MEITPEIRMSALESEVRYWKLRYELACKYTRQVYLDKEGKILRVSPIPVPELGDEVVEAGWFDVNVRGAILKQITLN